MASAVLVVVVSVVAAPVGAGKDFGGIAAINASIPPRSFDYQFITSQSDTCYFNGLTHAGFLFWSQLPTYFINSGTSPEEKKVTLAYKQ